MSRGHKSSAPSQRMLRVGELVRHALAQFMQRGEIDDDILFDAVITVPEVRMTPDLKLANCYIMPLGGKNADQIVAALNRHHRFIRGQIGHLIDLKYAPDLRFFVDDTFEEADRINAILKSDKVQRDIHSDDDDQNDD